MMVKETLDEDRIFVIREFLTAEECDAFVERSERAGYDDATITTSAGFVMAKEVRNNARLIVDDASLAEAWWQRAGPLLPPRVEGWRAVGFNERFRFYRYDPGQMFAPHFDGYFERRNGD